MIGELGILRWKVGQALNLAAEAARLDAEPARDEAPETAVV